MQKRSVLRPCSSSYMWGLMGLGGGSARHRGYRLHWRPLLAPDLIGALSLPFVGRSVVVLANGRAVETRVHRARVVWHGRERAAQVLATEGGPLVGMALLRGSRLTIDAAPGGSSERRAARLTWKNFA